MENFDTQIEQQVQAILQVMSQRVPPEDIARIRAAYELAREAHNGQKRKSGEPYIIHPVSVARIVAEELHLGANPVIAAFLHDVVEDTDVRLSDIRAKFGDDVAFLVEVVTKNKRKNPNAHTSQQVENFKHMLNSVQYDIRAILLKLADRLHNMRTLDSMPPDKQMKIAGETDFFYAPLATRLGLYNIKTELENLSFRYRCPAEYAKLATCTDHDKDYNREHLHGFTSQIISLLHHAGIKARTEIRYRMPYSIWRRMKNTGQDFHHLDFRHIVRIIYNCPDRTCEKDTALRIYSILTNVFTEKPGSIINYIDSPKENGYQSFHVKLLSENGSWEEIHISSEQMVANSRLGCVAERTEVNIVNWIDKFRAVLKDLAIHSREDRYMENVVSSFYNDDIFVFTPRGKRIILPKGASAIDFAFAIHTEIGKHAKYARINGRLTSVKTLLHRGDCVEIGTDPDILPQPDWLDYTLTYQAKTFINNYFRRQKKSDYNYCTHCRPLPGDEVVGFKETDGTVTIHKRDCREAISRAAQAGDSIVPADFAESPEVTYPANIHIRAVNRYHLLMDLISCITDELRLSISDLTSEMADEIVDCTIGFRVHSAAELNYATLRINSVEGVDEVLTENPVLD